MDARKFSFKKMIALGSTTVFTLLAVPLIADITHADHNVFLSAAHAADASSGDADKGGMGGGSGGAGSGGGSGSGSGGPARKGGAASGSGTDSGSGSSATGSGSSSTSGSGSSTSGGGSDAGGSKGSTSGSGSAGSGAGSAGSGGSGGRGQGGKPGSTATATEEGGQGQMGGGVHGQGSYQDNKQTGGAGAPGPGGINNEPNDAKGPRFSGGAGTGSTGGKPVWAQEGIPEVELGRLNVARAPGKLLDKQLVEALSALADLAVSGASVYQALTLDEAITMLLNDTTRIDSPLENLALLKDFTSDGVLDGDYSTLFNGTAVVDPSMTNEAFAALLLGSASDKTVAITTDTVKAMETLLGADFGDDAAIADMADKVRQAILQAHED